MALATGIEIAMTGFAIFALARVKATGARTSPLSDVQ